MRKCSRCGKEYSDNKKSGLCPECRSRLGKNNKSKGAAQERRISKLLQKYIDKYELGYLVRRTPRSGAIHEFEPSDFMFSRLPKWSVFANLHFESKVGHNWPIVEWFDKSTQIESERETNRNPVIVARKPGESRDFAIMDYEEYVKLLCELDKYRKETNG